MSATKRAKLEKRQLFSQRADGDDAKSTLVFHGDFGTRDLRLIEVTEEMAKLVASGQDLKIVGDATGGEAVLCTSDRTYSIKKVETSNHVFLVPPSSSSEFAISSRCSDYYELKPMQARVDQLGDLLRPTQYDGAEAEADSPSELQNAYFTRTDLEERVQASAKELQQALQSLGVVELKGKMRMLSKAAVREVCRELLDTMMENGWGLEALDEGQLRAAMSGTDHVLLRHSLTTLGSQRSGEGNGSSSSCSSSSSSSSSSKRGGGSGGGGEGLDEEESASTERSHTWDLNFETVAKTTSHLLFLSQPSPTKPWPCEDFISSWAARTPGTTSTPPTSLLSGVCIVIGGEGGAGGGGEAGAYRYFPVDDSFLSLDAASRFAQLFGIRAKYSQEELEPYFEDLVRAGGAKSIPELIVQHVRFVDGAFVAK